MAYSYYNLMIHIALPMICLFMGSNMGSVTGARPLPSIQDSGKEPLLARLKLDGEEGPSSTCWDSLFELQSCSGEVVLFFLNGETYLGPSCCSAIETIERQCWPALLGSLGYSDEEGDILRGYCDASEAEDSGTGTGITPHQPSSPPSTANLTTSINATTSPVYGLAP